jgi:hypothetical protein
MAGTSRDKPGHDAEVRVFLNHSGRLRTHTNAIRASNLFMINLIHDIPIPSRRSDRDWLAAPDASSREVEVASSLAVEKEKGHAD